MPWIINLFDKKSFCIKDNVQCPETCFFLPTRPVQSMFIIIQILIVIAKKRTDHLGHWKVAV